MLMRYLPIVVAVACITALLLLYDGMQPEPQAPAAAQTHRVELGIAQGHRSSGPAEIITFRGDRLHLQVSSDQASELHLHGYDKTLRPTPDQPAELDLLLEHSGRFELEVHGQGGHHGNVTVLTVTPR